MLDFQNKNDSFNANSLYDNNYNVNQFYTENKLCMTTVMVDQVNVNLQIKVMKSKRK